MTDITRSIALGGQYVQTLSRASRKPTAIGDMTREELDAELRKGLDSMNTGRTYSPEEVMKELNKEYGL